MKVILCHNHYKLPGGEDQVFDDECWLLEQYGHSVTRFEKHNRDIETMSKWSVARSTIGNSQAQDELGRLVQRALPDVVHFQNTFPLISPAAYDAVKKCDVPVVQTLHNFRMICPGSTLFRRGMICEKCVNKVFAWPSIIHDCYRDSKAATGAVMASNTFHRMRSTWENNVDVFIALTEHSRGIFVRAGLPEDKIVVKPNFVRPDPGPGAADGEYAVFVGRLSREKGIEVLLDAWLSHDCQIPLVIVGDGPLREQVVAAAAENSDIQWLGQLPFEQVLEKIQHAKLLVMPSIWYETFGRAMIEAFATGIPVVASNVGAMKEIVASGQNGLHFQAGSAADLACKVNRLVADGKMRTDMGRQARQTYEARFTAKKTTKC